MSSAKWIDLVVTLSLGTSSLALIRSYLRQHFLYNLYFSLAALVLMVPYIFDLLDLSFANSLFEWGKLIAVTFYISGLLALIRDSKPVFARFPFYLTMLPFVSFLFFPLIIDSIVIKNLINLIYQGGALAVTVLIFSLNQAKKRRRRYFIIGISSVIASYLSYWLIFTRTPNTHYDWIAEILLSIGILLVTFRFIRNDEMNPK